MRKYTLLAVAAAAYLLGSRAGREPYEKAAQKAQRIFKDSRVQQVAGQARANASKKADDVADHVTDRLSEDNSAHDPLAVPR